ncbi:MAG: DUF5112 domain-containing protein [Prevotella sp.]|nr:DUF5112 domain-containing protein [Prevotella sp.]
MSEKSKRNGSFSPFLTLFIYLSAFSSFLFMASCKPSHKDDADFFNSISYAFHYQDIDSTSYYALKALELSDGYAEGKAEAMNNLAFVNIVRMNYSEASVLLDSINKITDNQVELLISDIQQMRLCQRESRNKDFYEFHEKAMRSLKRIDEERDVLDEHLKRRLLYAETEFAIVKSTYYYYVGLEQQSRDALSAISVDEIEKDSAQYLNYLYQIGAGGIINEGTRSEINQKEWEYLVRCYIEARHCGQLFWEANALQAMSEHLFVDEERSQLLANNKMSLSVINPDNMPDSLLAGYLAQKSLEIFVEYGDVYQIAGAYRTLSQCYWTLKDYTSSIFCLENALKNDAIFQTPDLVASIRERLSLTYSAMDNKPQSDFNRNIYLDMQEITRQDRQLEARAEQLNRNSKQLNFMMAAVILMIAIVVFSLYVFDYLRRKKDQKDSLSALMEPLHKWKKDNEQQILRLNETYEDINERYGISKLHYQDNKRRYTDNRAKMFLVNSVMPFIDRIIHEVNHLKNEQESSEITSERLTYLSELTDKINEYNTVLTQWIQLQQGQLSLHIESFRLQELFDIVAKSRMSFLLKDISLSVKSTDDVVKADKIMTLFMINTIADNARKFTSAGGEVEISSSSTDQYVEISVKDTGSGLSEEQLSGIFDHKVYNGHGFGLMNCKGIIDKYRKMSQLFGVCSIGAESKTGEGSRFFFRLPRGVVHSIVAFFLCMLPFHAGASRNELQQAVSFADSVYMCNIRGEYRNAINYADSSIACFNKYHLETHHSGDTLMTKYDNGQTVPAEIIWYHDSVRTNFEAILTMRNECAVAALAVHDWELYRYNNSVYTQLYKEMSADNSLEVYVSDMKRVESNKTIAIFMLVILLFVILFAYYFLYYRHQLYYRFCVEQIGKINRMLLGDEPDEDKLSHLNSQIATGISRWPDNLYHIVNRIKTALQESVDSRNDQNLSIELAEDNLHRAEYENQKLYVCNNVLDNCLSTLKHETMYYPSRIHQLVEEDEPNVTAIDEVVSYYKELYTILSAQAMRQLDSIKTECKPVDVYGVEVLGDKLLFDYMFSLLKKQAAGAELHVRPMVKDENYVVFTVALPQLTDTDLFTPKIRNIPFMVCRQIVRDTSEATNMRGCGIVAEQENDKGLVLHITLALSKRNQHSIKQ